MHWLIIIGVFAALLLLGLGLRRYVCFRRKDCCGKGCGCLFPVKSDETAARR
ncbi:MAG: hypothetical protein QM760_10620 [Nibricoccus sp.]